VKLWAVHVSLDSRCGWEEWKYIIQCDHKTHAESLAIEAWLTDPYVQKERQDKLEISSEQLEQALPFSAVWHVGYQEYSR
jgi:hypothetical protein